LRFQIFKEGKVVERFSLHGAYLFGTDGIVVRRAQIGFKNGFIECRKQNLGTGGLALLWPVAGFGKVLLPTTCLPDREQPYVLNVEIARAKLMQIVNKREDWLFFDGLGSLGELSRQAQGLFIQALQNISDPAVASKLADASLQKAVVFSEKLACKQAELAFSSRARSHGFGRGCLGCRLDPSRVGEVRYLEALLQLFGSATIPVNWAEMEPEPGKYDFSRLDACVNVLGRRRVTLGAGPLLFFAKRYLPKWLVDSGADFEKIRERAYRFILQVVSRYGSVIRTWYVVSGLNVFNYFGFRFEEIVEMTRAATMAARQANERVLRIIEICNPWGEYYAMTPASVPPLVYMDMVVQSGISFEGFGLQMRFGRNQTGMHVRDLMQVSAILDTFGLIGKPVYLTNVAVPSAAGSGPLDGEVAGIWHGQWDESLQSEWLEQFYKIALSKPFIEMVSYGNVVDADNSTIAYSGLLTKKLEPKMGFSTLKKLREVLFHSTVGEGRR